MANAKRDENRSTVALVITDDGTETTIPLKVDPVTGRVLVSLSAPSGAAVGGQTHIPRDANRVTAIAVVDDNGLVCPLLIDPSSGAVLCDLISG